MLHVHRCWQQPGAVLQPDYQPGSSHWSHRHVGESQPPTTNLMCGYRGGRGGGNPSPRSSSRSRAGRAYCSYLPYKHIWGGGEGLLHVDMFAHNKSGIAYRDGNRRSETVVNHTREPHRQPRLLPSCTNHLCHSMPFGTVALLGQLKPLCETRGLA
jgi:hypothetical protein